MRSPGSGSPASLRARHSSRRPSSRQEEIEVLRRAGLDVKGERVAADHDVLNPVAGELLQQLFEVGRKVHARGRGGASARPTCRKRSRCGPPDSSRARTRSRGCPSRRSSAPHRRPTFDDARRRGNRSWTWREFSTSTRIGRSTAPHRQPEQMVDIVALMTMTPEEIAAKARTSSGHRGDSPFEERPIATDLPARARWQTSRAKSAEWA
jgi:hypothetical protein